VFAHACPIIKTALGAGDYLVRSVGFMEENQALLKVVLFEREASAALHNASAIHPVCPWCSQCA